MSKSKEYAPVIAEVKALVQKQTKLASEAASGSLDPVWRRFLNLEFPGLKEEIERISHATEFNGIYLRSHRCEFNEHLFVEAHSQRPEIPWDDNDLDLGHDTDEGSGDTRLLGEKSNES